MSDSLISSARPSSSQLSLWLIIPIKPLGEGKSRLATTLTPDLRAELSQQWLTHVLQVAMQWGYFAGIAVISRDSRLLSWVAALGAYPVEERGDDLNAAVEQARAEAIRRGAKAVLMLPSDLPLLTNADLDNLYHLALSGDGVILAPSQDGGTNALLLRPPHAIPYAFGEGSFTRHIELATAAGLPHAVYNSETLALDIDHPEDLLQIQS